MLLVLLLLKLLGQLQVAKTQCALRRLLLQGQGDQVVLERGKDGGGEGGWGRGMSRLRLGFQPSLSWEFPGSPVVRTLSFHWQGARVQSLVRELRSHKLCGQKNK